MKTVSNEPIFPMTGQAVAIQKPQEIAPTPIQMMQSIIAGGVTKDNVLAFEKLAELQWKFEARDAEKTFASAFAELQSKVKAVKATHAVKTKQGELKFKVAKFEEVMEQLTPLLSEGQFTLSFEQKYEEGMPLRVSVVCTLQHVPSGHKIERSFTVRVGQGPPGASEFQADGAASSYAKMRVLCSCLNIVIEQAIGDDASALGDIATKITKTQAEELEHRLAMVNGKPSDFLNLAGAKSFAEIPAATYPIMDRFLQKREQSRL